ncbi:MAG: hypothetical protein AAGF47_12430 [Planctomycetota bacterium]
METTEMGRAEQIDRLMESASRALAATDYFVSIELSVRSVRLSVATKDWERLARICLPLQEARRQVRQAAVDAAEGKVRLIDTPTQLRSAPRPGCYLVQPPQIGADASGFRVAAWKRRVPVFVLAREPRTRSGRWPIVGVDAVSVRTQVDPPEGVVADPSLATGDRCELPISTRWFEAACEQLGDAGIRSVDPSEPAAHRVEALIERLDAVPEHEKLHQRLAEAARHAIDEPEPTLARRGSLGHPYSF